MLPKKQRLNLEKTKNRDIFSSSNKFKTNRFLVFYRSGKTFKASAVVPKKKIPLAVDRNRIKRKIYAILEKHQIRKNKIEIVILLTASISSEAKIANKIIKALDQINEEHVEKRLQSN
jgi:ribonuclease P protein component